MVQTRLTYLTAILLSVVAAHGAAAERMHPLTPLSQAEITTAVATLRSEKSLRDDVFFPMLTLHEPTKEELNAFAVGQRVQRRAEALLMDRPGNRTIEAIVDLGAKTVLQFREVAEVHPLVLVSEYDTAAEIVRADPRWQAAIRRRGIEDFDKVNLDAWAPGFLKVPGSEKARLMRVLAFYRGDGVNAYGRPIEGVVAVVNLNTKKVVQLVETDVAPVADGKQTDIFAAAAYPAAREAPKPLRITQPDGVSFTIEGNEIRWQKWRFRYALHPREGLVLHTVGYEDADSAQPSATRVRPILHRASVAEMVVPYGDASETWNWRAAFDQGEYGLGHTCNSMQLGVDVPENAVLLDTVFADDLGGPYVKPASVAVYEQDGGLLWKHYDETSERAVARRGRQLVVSYVTTIGNYDYCLNWIFHQDGTLEARVDLTGILLVKGVPPQECAVCAEQRGEKPVRDDQRYGTLVDRTLVATNHQHLFNFRLDFDIEGTQNSVSELNVAAAPPGADNPAGNAFIHTETPLKTEHEARRRLSLAEHRRWKVFNPATRNELGHFAAYALVPGDNALPFVTADAPLRRRAGFIDQHLWATRFRDGEEHAAGDYPRQRSADEGLPEWSGQESLDKQDIVLWYTLGVTHVPRAEEWPVMPAAHAGFKLIPIGFFSRNPALDLPESKLAPATNKSIGTDGE